MADNSKRVICLLFIFKLIFEKSTGESVVLCNLGFCGIILAVGALRLAILSAAAGARLESQCAHKDIRIPGTEKLIKQTLLCVLSTILQSEYIR